jgi:surface protein
MFYNAAAFNRPINNWNTGNVVVSMANMFQNATAFSQALCLNTLLAANTLTNSIVCVMTVNSI